MQNNYIIINKTAKTEKDKTETNKKAEPKQRMDEKQDAQPTNKKTQTCTMSNRCSIMHIIQVITIIIDQGSIANYQMQSKQTARRKTDQ